MGCMHYQQHNSDATRCQYLTLMLSTMNKWSIWDNVRVCNNIGFTLLATPIMMEFIFRSLSQSYQSMIILQLLFLCPLYFFPYLNLLLSSMGGEKRLMPMLCHKLSVKKSWVLIAFSMSCSLYLYIYNTVWYSTVVLYLSSYICRLVVLYFCLISFLVFPCTSVWQNTCVWGRLFNITILNSACSFHKVK